MRKFKILAVAVALMIMLTACNTKQLGSDQNPTSPNFDNEIFEDAVDILLNDEEIKVAGVSAETDAEDAVYIANDIIYYEAGKDFTYGEGEADDAHSPDVAAEHTVVHITQPGMYSISGTLSKGQIAVDLGDGAKKDPNAVVTLILNGIDITCEVAPAIIFYNVYECGTDDTENASNDVDTSCAGANIVIADGTTNTVNGSYVARIYRPDSVVLNEAGTKVEDAKKLHKYDGAIYSKMSMNIGCKKNTGCLTINAENEGLDSELHLTINGGIININSGNDGINTNEDGVSVTTINCGELHIKVNGETGEGDGIDSNGWLVINGGIVTAQACSFSADAGIDSDMGIHINGGTVIATGHMLDKIEDGGQNYAVFTFAEKQDGSKIISLKNEKGDSVIETCPGNDYSVLIYSSPELAAGTYTLWSDGEKLSGQRDNMMSRPGMQGMPNMPFEGINPPERPEGQAPDGNMPPEGMEPPQGDFPSEPPAENDWDNRAEDQWKPDHNKNDRSPQEATADFKLSDGGNMFKVVS